jgi:hypothetical protein
MSWLFSQALVEEYLVDTSLVGEQSVQLNGKPTQQAYCAPDKMTDFSRLSRFGMMYKPLTENLGEKLLMLYQEDFHAKTLVQREKAQELMESEAECGDKWRGSFTKYDPDLSLWKTHQCSLLGDLEEFLEIWPQWGLMRDGECWEQRMLEQNIRGTEFGLSENKELWPTPCLPGNGGTNGKAKMKKMLADKWPTPATKGYGHAAEGMVGNLIEKIEQGVITKLEAEQMLSLPKLENHRTWKKKFPTPQASDNRDRGNMSNAVVQRRVAIGKQILLSQSVSPTSGQLNPTWVEWLMGWPLEWTDLKPLEMDKFLSVQQQPGES